jgi:hypothetical protein
MHGRKRRHGFASDRRTPRPWTFFGVAAGLLACRSSSHPVFPMRGRISDVRIGGNSLLTVAGAAPDSRRLSRDTPASLLATKSCDPVDRDAYMWCHSQESVNGVEKTYARNFKKFSQTRRRRGSRTRFCRRLEEVFPDIPPRCPKSAHSRSRRGIGRKAGSCLVIVGMEQAAYDAQGADWNQEVFPPIRALRKLLYECSEALAAPRAIQR